MSRTGHAITAFALASVVVSVDPSLAGVLTGAGVLAGASIPDSIECPTWRENGRRDSILPHRTISHYVPLWLAVALCANFAPTPWSHVLLGVALAAILHILIDALSPMGVPLLDPFRRYSLPSPVYRTGTSSEFPVIIIALVIAGCAVLARGPAMAHLFRSA